MYVRTSLTIVLRVRVATCTRTYFTDYSTQGVGSYMYVHVRTSLTIVLRVWVATCTRTYFTDYSTQGVGSYMYTYVLH